MLCLVLVCAVHVLVVIPARVGSVRLPGKPLRKIAGEPLIRLVASKVLEFGLECEVVVATDDREVVEAVAPIGVKAVLTASSHRSGTERIGELLQRPDYASVETVLNVQGDELFVTREAVLGALECVDSGYPIGTAAAPVLVDQMADPDRVKVAVDSAGRALWFSRFVEENRPTKEVEEGVYLHTGVYAYTREAVIRWIGLPVSAGEKAEGLEQLRPMDHGVPIGVAVLHEQLQAGIDTAADLSRARSLFNHIGTNR